MIGICHKCFKSGVHIELNYKDQVRCKNCMEEFVK